MFLQRIVSEEANHFWIHCAVSIYQLHRLWTVSAPHEIGARIWSRGPGGVKFSWQPSESVAQVP